MTILFWWILGSAIADYTMMQAVVAILKYRKMQGCNNSIRPGFTNRFFTTYFSLMFTWAMLLIAIALYYYFTHKISIKTDGNRN